MKTIVVDGLLALAVLSAWLGCLGFARLERAWDRLHCVAFVNATVGPLFTLAAFADEGVTTRSLKILAVALIALLAGAATSHAIGRTVLLREGRRA